jgi:hypothetical protein
MKMDILRDAHYVYNFERELYYNPESKKAFSFPFIDDHGEDELARSIDERTDGSGWKFYFNFPPCDHVRRELEGLLANDSRMHLHEVHGAS